jgi:hypothetical protein
MVCATLIPFRALTDPRPNLEQLTLPVMLTAFASAFMEEDCAEIIGAMARTPAIASKEILVLIVFFMVFLLWVFGPF